MQLLAKFKKILYMGFRATLNFRKFKVALNPMFFSKMINRLTLVKDTDFSKLFCRR